MTQMKRNIQDRMSTIESDVTLPVQLYFSKASPGSNQGIFHHKPAVTVHAAGKYAF
jgi:hypothetical protein